MKQHALISALKEFDKNSWLLMGLMFFVKAGFFMTIPYFSFYLYYRGYSPVEIGLVAAAGPLVASLLNIWSGFLTDKFGKKSAMIWAFLIFSAANGGIAWFDGFWVYLLLNSVLRLADSTFNGAMQSYFADSFTKEVQHYVFHVRFMVGNAAAAIGPIAGALFAEAHTKILFDISAVISIIAAITLYFWLDMEEKKIKKADNDINTEIQTALALKSGFTLKSAIQTLLKDPSLLWVTAGFFIFWFSYIQLDSTLAQILSKQFPDHAVYWFAMFWVINTVLIVICQLPIAHLTRHYSYKKCIWLSSLFMMAGFFVIANFLSLYGLMISIVLITFGEILLSPMGNVLIAEIANPELRATYFGAFNLSFVGAGLAPIIGGACLTFMSSQVLYMLLGGLFLLLAFFMLKAVKPLSKSK